MKKHNCDDSKIVEASRMFLEEKNGLDNNNNNKNNLDDDDNYNYSALYKKLNKEKSLEKIKNLIAKNIEVQNIIYPDKEIKEKYNERNII